MSRFILLFLFVSLPASAQTPLKNVVLKDGPQSGWTCYDPKSLEAIDASQKRGLDCEVKLKAAQQQLDILKNQIQRSALTFNEPIPEWYDATWFKVTVGAALGLSLGIIVGSSF